MNALALFNQISHKLFHCRRPAQHISNGGQEKLGTNTFPRKSLIAVADLRTYHLYIVVCEYLVENQLSDEQI